MSDPITAASVSVAVARVFVRVFQSYFRILNYFLEPFYPFFRDNLPPSFRKFIANVDAPLDDRIAKIDAARANLLEGLTAIDELRAEAERNKRTVQETAQKLADLSSQRAIVEKQVEEVAKLAAGDTETLRTVIGLPTVQQRFWDRFFGFCSGVIASLVAWGLTELVKHFWPKL